MALHGEVGGSFETVEAGLHIARCIRIIDKGTHWNEKFGNSIHELTVMFELPETRMQEGKNKDKPFAISLGFGGVVNLSMSAKSNLRKNIESWKGKKFTDTEAEKFDILGLVGTTAYINIIHSEKDDNVYANISSIIPFKGECPPAINELLAFSLSDFDQAVFDKLTEKQQERIKESREWDFRFNKQKPGDIEMATNEREKELNPAEIFDTDIELELDEDYVDFKKEWAKLKPRNWINCCALFSRKMGDLDFLDTFKRLGYVSHLDVIDKEQQMSIAGDLKKVCEARE